MARNFSSSDFKVYVPSVQIKRKLKNGSISTKPKPLFPGCVFLRCVMNKELHDFIRECNGVGGFVGSKVGNTTDMEAIFKRAKAEQEKTDQAFEEQQQTEGILDSKRIDVMSPSVSKDDAQSNTTTTARGRDKKAANSQWSEKLHPWHLVQLSKLHQGLLLDFQASLRRSMKLGWQPLALRYLGRKLQQISM